MLKPVDVGVTKVTPALKQTDKKNNEKPKTGNSESHEDNLNTSAKTAITQST